MFSLMPPQKGKEAGCRAEGLVADTDTDTDRINSNYSLAMIAHLEKFEVRMVSVSLAVASGPTFSPRYFTCFSFRLLKSPQSCTRHQSTIVPSKHRNIKGPNYGEWRRRNKGEQTSPAHFTFTQSSIIQKSPTGHRRTVIE